MKPNGTPQYEREIHIGARPEIVFSFFTDPEKMKQWKGVEAELDPQPGGIYRVVVTENNTARGEFVELVPHRRIVFTWGWEEEENPLRPGTSTVEVTLEPNGSGTLLRLRHDGLPEIAIAGQSDGWEHYLDRLATAAVGTNPGPDPWAQVTEG